MSATKPRIQRAIHLISRPVGTPKLENFRLVESPLDELQPGEFLVQNKWISVDPYMRGRMRGGKSYVEPFELNQPMDGGCVGEVVASNHGDYAPGDCVLGNKGWRDY